MQLRECASNTNNVRITISNKKKSVQNGYLYYKGVVVIKLCLIGSMNIYKAGFKLTCVAMRRFMADHISQNFSYQNNA